MPSRDPTRYSGEEIQDEHVQEGLNAFRGAYQREQSARSEFRDQFSHQLDGAAHTVFKYQENLTRYDDPDRHNVLYSYAHTLNHTGFNTPKERYEAAQDIAATVFNPLMRQADLQEMRTYAQEFQIPQALLFDVNYLYR